MVLPSFYGDDGWCWLYYYDILWCLGLATPLGGNQTDSLTIFSFITYHHIPSFVCSVARLCRCFIFPCLSDQIPIDSAMSKQWGILVKRPRKFLECLEHITYEHILYWGYHFISTFIITCISIIIDLYLYIYIYVYHIYIYHKYLDLYIWFISRLHL